MTDSILSDIDAAVEAGIKIGTQKAFSLHDNQIGVMVPKGFELKVYDKKLPKPEYTENTVNLDTAESFIEYFNRYADESSVISCDINDGSFRGIIDYHTKDQPEYGRHICEFTCKRTEEWTQWRNYSGCAMSQEEFAYFIEQHAEEIITPTPADMLEIALSLRAKKNINFDKAIRLDNGQTQLEYTEVIKGTAGARGQLAIPEIIEIGVKLFEGGEGYKMQSRFRYRIKEGQLAMWYELIRPHKAHQKAVNDAFNLIKEQANHSMIVHGTL